MRLGLGLGLTVRPTASGDPPELPDGFAYLVNAEGKFIINGDGSFIIVTTGA